MTKEGKQLCFASKQTVTTNKRTKRLSLYKMADLRISFELNLKVNLQRTFSENRSKGLAHHLWIRLDLI